MAIAPGANMLSTNVWLTIVFPVGVKTHRSLEIKLFVKVKNTVPCNDWSHLWLCNETGSCTKMTPKYKVSDMLCNCLLSNTRWCAIYLHTIACTLYEILLSQFLLMQYFVWSSLWHFDLTFGSPLWHFWCKQENFTIFVLEILLKYQVINWWLNNLLMWSNKEADFVPEIKNVSLSLEWAFVLYIEKKFITYEREYHRFNFERNIKTLGSN